MFVGLMHNVAGARATLVSVDKEDGAVFESAGNPVRVAGDCEDRWGFWVPGGRC